MDDLLLLVDASIGSVELRFLHGGGVDSILAEEPAADSALWSVVDQFGTVRG